MGAAERSVIIGSSPNNDTAKYDGRDESTAQQSSSLLLLIDDNDKPYQEENEGTVVDKHAVVSKATDADQNHNNSRQHTQEIEESATGEEDGKSQLVSVATPFTARKDQQ